MCVIDSFVAGSLICICLRRFFYAIARIVKWGLTITSLPLPFHHSLKCNLDSYDPLYSLYVILNVFGVVHEVNFPAAALVDEALQSIVYSINTGNNA